MLKSALLSVFLVLLVACAQAFVTPSTARSSTSLGVAIDTSDIKNGLTIELDGEPYKVRYLYMPGNIMK